MASARNVPVYNPAGVGLHGYRYCYVCMEAVISWHFAVIGCQMRRYVDFYVKKTSGLLKVQNVVQPDFPLLMAFTAYEQKFLMMTAA